MINTLSLPTSIFGYSLIFGNKLHELPTMFMPLTFYPDWYFMAWPYYIFLNIIHPNTCQYYTAHGGEFANGFAIFYLIIGFLMMFCGILDGVNYYIEYWYRPLAIVQAWQNSANGITKTLLAIPMFIINAVWVILYYILAGILYWHILDAIIIGGFFTVLLQNWVSMSTLEKIRNIVFTIMLAPALVMIGFTIYTILMYVFFKN